MADKKLKITIPFVDLKAQYAAYRSVRSRAGNDGYSRYVAQSVVSSTPACERANNNLRFGSLPRAA
jgi:hypothetical protein